MRERLNNILVSHTGQTLEVIERDVERDFYMDSEAAKVYGLVDHVLYPETEAVQES